MIQKIKIDDICFSHKLLQSLRDTGFAIITDHYLPSSLLENNYEHWADFFANEERKKAYLYGDDHAGFFPMASETAKGFDVADIKEFFHFYPSKIQDPSIDGHTGKLYELLNLMALDVLMSIGEALPESITQKLSMPLYEMVQHSNMTLLRILHYPPTEDIPEGAVRAAEHEDINLITLLPAATETGLEVKDSNGNWIRVETNPNDIIVNVGDMLQEATDGFLKSTPHRVVNVDMDKSRYSMPLFLHPRPSVKLSDAYTAESYLDERLKELGLK